MQQKFAAHPPSPARRRVSASCTGRDPAANLRCGNTSQSAYGCQLPSRGAFPLRRRAPKPPLEGRWHAKRDGEVCRPQGGGASAPSAQTETLRNLSVRQHLSGAPRQLPSRGAFVSGDAPPSLSLRGGGTRSVTERCAARRAAARERPLRRPKPCGKSSVRKHLSSGAGWRILRGFAPRYLGLRRHSKNSSISQPTAASSPQGEPFPQVSGPVPSAG